MNTNLKTQFYNNARTHPEHLPISMSKSDSNRELCLLLCVLSFTRKEVVEEQKSLARPPALLPTDNIHLLICSRHQTARLYI